MRVWKWALEITDLQTLELPVGAKILTVQLQREAPQLWALCDGTETRKELRQFAIYGTGNPVMHGGRATYISTFQLFAGSAIFHVFELDQPTDQQKEG